MTQSGVIALVNVTKRFGTTVAVDNINLQLPHGSYCCLLGPSGCGKTTILRLIAGHEDFVAHLADSDFFTQHVDIGDRVVARWAVEDVHRLETEHVGTPARAVAGQPYGWACDAPAT